MKLVLKVLLGLVLLVVLAVAVVFLWLDPNVFKPRIEALASEQGVHLEIRGDLSWQFWPSVGIEINDIALASAQTPNEPLASLASASLLVATRPLFDGELVVEHLLVEGARVDLVSDAQGRGNWENLIRANAEASPEDLARAKAAGADRATALSSSEEASSSDEPKPEGESGQALKLAVERISIADTEVSFKDEAKGSHTKARLASLVLNGFNLEDRPFDLSLDASAEVNDPAAFAKPLVAEVHLEAQMQMDAAINRFVLAGGQLALTLGEGASQARVATEFALTVEGLQEQLRYTGQLAVEPVNLKALLASLGQAVPETAREDALTRLSFSTDVVGSKNALTLAPVEMTLDDTTFSGELAVNDISKQALLVTLAGNSINVDHYLPPPAPDAEAGSSSSAPKGKAPAAETPPEAPIPLEPIRALNAQVSLDLAKAIVNKLTFENLRLRLSAKDGLVQLSEASLDTYQGHLQADATFDARGNKAKAAFNADMAGVRLQPLLADLEMNEKVQLTGALNLDATGTTSGVLASELFEKLVAEARFSGAEVTFAPINVEKYFCKMVSLVRDEAQSEDGKTSEEREWPEFTPLRALEGRVNIRDQKVTVDNFSAGVEQLLLATQGNLDLAGQTYDFRLPLTLLEKATSEQGCTVKSNYWLNRSLSLLRCKGSLENLQPLKDCGLDSKALESLTADYAKYRVQKELVRKLGGDNKNGENKDGESTGQDDTSKAVEGLLNRFLKKDKE